MIQTITWTNGKIKIIDQTKLPLTEEVLELEDPLEVAAAIKDMKIRGAPAIGVAAALGVALAVCNSAAKTTNELLEEINEVCQMLSETRPTAVNLFWALDRMKKTAAANSALSASELRELVREEAISVLREDVEINRKMGACGAQLIDDGDNVLTHCNAGALATSAYGTALGVIRAAVSEGKRVHVFVDETRPLLQGARLTAWELKKDNIALTLIADDMAGYFMAQGKVSKIIVGADRIAANGDVANKIGTYSLAVLAKEHDIPFYVAAPTSTVDLGISSGSEIPIEERSADEVMFICGRQIAPTGIDIANPAFDVTPSRYISAIITEKGIVRPPYRENLKAVFDQRSAMNST